MFPPRSAGRSLTLLYSPLNIVVPMDTDARLTYNAFLCPPKWHAPFAPASSRRPSVVRSLRGSALALAASPTLRDHNSG